MPLATFQQNDRLGEIVIDSPPLNLFSVDLLADLRAAVDQAADSDIRALLLRAEGELTHAEGPAVMLSQDTQEGIASLQRYGPGHANFNNR
jgi:enoyl-CoA hydratase/carnithine racemase